MKKNHLLAFGLFVLVLMGTHFIASAQSDTALVRKKVEERVYTFVAQTATPLRGRLIQITGSYDLRVTVDSVVSYLPYYGRAYTAPMGSEDVGMNFTSVSFEYESAWKKKKWEITIKPKDYRDINEINLTIFPNGNASLRISSNSRQPISYSGYIRTK